MEINAENVVCLKVTLLDLSFTLDCSFGLHLDFLVRNPFQQLKVVSLCFSLRIAAEKSIPFSFLILKVH